MTQREAEFEFNSVLCLTASLLTIALASAVLHALAYSAISVCLGNAFPRAMPWIGYAAFCSAVLFFLATKNRYVYGLQRWLHYGRSLKSQKRLADKLAIQAASLRQSIRKSLWRIQQESDAYRSPAVPANNRLTNQELSHLLARLQPPGSCEAQHISEQIGQLQETEDHLALLATERFELQTRIESCPD